MEMYARITQRIRGYDDQDIGLTLLSGGIAAFILLPLIWLLIRSTYVDISRAREVLFRPTTAQIFINSILLVILVTTLSLLIGVPLAVLTVQTDLPFRRFWTIAVALPLVIPSYIGAFAYMSGFGPNGVIANVLSPLGIETVPAVVGLSGTVLVLTLFTYPYVFLTTRAALLSFNSTLLEAARSLNHSRWSAFRNVTLPRILPGIAAGALLVALYTLSDFGTPAIMRYDVFTRIIYVEYGAYGKDFAALLSVQLVVITTVILAIESQLEVPESTNQATLTNRKARQSLGIWKYPATIYCLVVVTLALLLPLGILFYWLFHGSAGITGTEFSIEYAVNSVYVSGLAAIVAVLAAIPVAYHSARNNSLISRLFERATYIGYAVPGVVIGLALVSFGLQYAQFLYQTIPLLIFAYIVRFLPQAVGTIRTSTLQMDPALIDAARSLGHSSVSTFRRVTLPLIGPGVIAGGALVFLTTMKELPATLMLGPIGFETIVTYIWIVQKSGYYGKAAIPALILVAISGLSMVVLLARGDFRGQQ
ncbi:MAG: ABC transporter permease [Halobacteriaceae archaeon]